METIGIIGVILGLYWGYMGIMEKKMETSKEEALVPQVLSRRAVGSRRPGKAFQRRPSIP